jgi:hypothetical protein
LTAPNVTRGPLRIAANFIPFNYRRYRKRRKLDPHGFRARRSVCSGASLHHNFIGSRNPSLNFRHRHSARVRSHTSKVVEKKPSGAVTEPWKSHIHCKRWVRGFTVSKVATVEGHIFARLYTYSSHRSRSTGRRTAKEGGGSEDSKQPTAGDE